ncbi:chemotaxis protein CheV [Bacterioplanoides sp. SCSIO 12839]|uniref:chemotaxis protein CheV n=1 Tax=Bacterioplanoides sp. SCSIO 12839 TaxID=2829569 RepID=UPI0021042C81|nr:chemotaxis protein CheV [Bacterioplanoides sp. SCSIO 12839]UTW47312.1 chemotaxis protein CheV [Bacterioplanoides sp. SCSIO 12839]
MAGVLDTVNQRTQLVGENRLELLLFRVNGAQIYGINVFKVREVLQCPELTILPGSHPVVRGVAHIRSGTLPIMDMSMATGNAPLPTLDDTFVIITEYNGKTQGFLVAGVERIVNMNWEEIHPPPKGTGRDHYLTAVTEVDNQLVEIIDVEKILAEVAPINEEISEGVISEEVQEAAHAQCVMIVDDSKIARKQITRCLEHIGVEVVALNDGKEAWEHLESIVEGGESPSDRYMMLISDIEMPEMDGYTLTSRIRSDSRMGDFYVVLHSSLSGVFNKAMVEKVGADNFIAKFDPDVLAEQVALRIDNA